MRVTRNLRRHFADGSAEGCNAERLETAIDFVAVFFRRDDDRRFPTEGTKDLEKFGNLPTRYASVSPLRSKKANQRRILRTRPTRWNGREEV
jgi:hypothetical protein